MADYYRRGLKIDFDNTAKLVDPDGYTEYWQGKKKPGSQPPLPRAIPVNADKLRDLYAEGGMVKKGSYTTPSMASNSKVIRSRSK